MVTIRTFDEIYNDILNDYATAQGVDVSELDITYKVEAKVMAGQLYPIYLTISQMQNNVYPDLAEQDVLERFGFAILNRYPARATQGYYNATVIGQIGSVIPANTQYQANSDTLASGFIFTVDTDITLTATSQVIQIRALTSGLNALLYQTDELTCLRPIVNINDTITVTSVVTNPTDAESIESYRIDVLEGIRLLSQGGSPYDYRLWALVIPEIRTVYPYVVQNTPGNIKIYVEATPEASDPLEAVGAPTQATMDAYYLNDAGVETGALIWDDERNVGRKPLTVNNITIASVIPIDVNIEFTGLSDESILPTIKTALEDLVYNIRPFIAGAQSIATKNDELIRDFIAIEVINILAGTGISYTSFVMNVDGNPETSYIFDNGEYPVINTVTNV